MTEVTMTLPDNLAQEARAAGLLTPQALEAMLRETLRPGGPLIEVKSRAHIFWESIP
jgi:hypothetical protein